MHCNCVTVSQRSCAMLRVCLSVCTTLQNLECNLLLLVTSASDLPMRTIKFCSTVLSVMSRLCHKQHLLTRGSGCVSSVSQDQQTMPLKCYNLYSTVRMLTKCDRPAKPDVGQKSQFLPQSTSEYCYV